MQRNPFFLMPLGQNQALKSQNPEIHLNPTALYLHFAKDTWLNKFLQKLLISASSKDMERNFRMEEPQKRGVCF